MYVDASFGALGFFRLAILSISGVVLNLLIPREFENSFVLFKVGDPQHFIQKACDHTSG